MEKILICYFSGTGNTKKVLDKAKECFEMEGSEVTLFNMDNKEFNFNLNDFDMVGIGYPVHAFNAPSIVIDFAKKLKKLEKGVKKPLFVIKTSGEPLALNNISSLKLKSVMKKKGFVLTNEYHFCMPYNIIFRHTDNMAYRMWNTAERAIPIVCKEILDGKPGKIKYFPFGHFLAWIMRVEHWGGRFNGKRYKVREECVQCGLCVKRCPVGNIKIEDGKFVFGKKCLMCMRCSFYCPKDAIKIGWFEKWKVNGAYNFNNPSETEKETHKKYCRKSYNKYFARLEKKISENQKNNN